MYSLKFALCCSIEALHENARREETQVLEVQQWLQHRVGPEETHRRLWEDLQMHVWLPLRQPGGSSLARLQDGSRDPHGTQARGVMQSFL